MIDWVQIGLSADRRIAGRIKIPNYGFHKITQMQELFFKNELGNRFRYGKKHKEKRKSKQLEKISVPSHVQDTIPSMIIYFHRVAFSYRHGFLVIDDGISCIPYFISG